jgi:hypothetical protein
MPPLTVFAMMTALVMKTRMLAIVVEVDEQPALRRASS